LESDALSPELVLRQLEDSTGILVAYSGGLDSRVLLELVVQAGDRLPGPLRALHVDHGLHPHSADWVRHCVSVCESLDVPLLVERVTVESGPSPEAMARDARYRAFARHLRTGEALLTAHHRDDQAETVLLRLMRGGGVYGLRAMPSQRPFARGRLCRPLLDVPRSTLHAWAGARRLDWIDDPSNRETAADRNHIRHAVMPALEQRWPGAARRLARVAADADEAGRLLDTLADLDGAPDGPRLHRGRLDALDRARRCNVLRRWIRSRDQRPPDRRRLIAGLQMLLGAAPDRQPQLIWAGGRLRRYRDWLYLDDGIDPEPPVQPLPWSASGSLELDCGRLLVRETRGGLARESMRADDLRLVFGRPGARCRPTGRPGKRVKELFQEAGVPPWQRPGWPLLMAGDTVVAVPGICVCEGHAAAPGEPGLELIWEPRG